MKQYVLGTDDAERQRLGIQHRLWAAQAHRAWEIAGLQPGWGVLDIGCGPGWAAMDMAQLVGPAGAVLGVDESQPYIAAFNQLAQNTGTTWASATAGDVQQLTQAAAGRGPFDMAWIRWVLCFLPSPEPVVRQAAELLRDRGRLVIQDYFNYASMTLAPRSQIFDKIIDAIKQSWLDSKGNPDVMGDIHPHIRDAGMKVIHFDVIQRIARPGQPMWAWPAIFWQTFLPRIVASGHLSEQTRLDFLDEWNRRSADPDTFIHLPTVYELVAEKR